MNVIGLRTRDTVKQLDIDISQTVRVVVHKVDNYRNVRVRDENLFLQKNLTVRGVRHAGKCDERHLIFDLLMDIA